MASSYRPSKLLQLLYLFYFQGFEAQNLKMWPQVTGYLGQDVRLPCHFSHASQTNVTQVEWNLLQPDGNRAKIIVVNKQFGEVIPDSPLKGRIKISEYSLIIQDVRLSDAGSYICSLATFPLGSFEQTTKLVVQKQMPLSPGIISAIVTIVVLLLIITAAMTYLFFIRKCNSAARHRVLIDTTAPIDVTRPSVIRRDEEVVYSDVTLKTHKGGTPSSNDKHREAADADNVTYSEVIISPLQYVSPSVHI